ncbi:MAG: hypothetical protein ACTH4Y_08255 [Microbacterium gubbeenense]|uniref:hypothetical protein n=1 Tax=Microbacterium gubbeenense TaxID=159896 RepID=UPI003F9CA6B2
MTTHHYVELTVQGSELHPRFRCDAPEDAFCRRRPPRHAETGQESWTEEEAEVPGHDCWAEEWIAAVGIDDALRMDAADGVLASVPVDIRYDEGVEATPVNDHTGWVYGYELIESDTRDVLTRGGAFATEDAARYWARKEQEDESCPDYPPLDVLIVRRRKEGPWEPIDGETND